MARKIAEIDRGLGIIRNSSSSRSGSFLQHVLLYCVCAGPAGCSLILGEPFEGYGLSCASNLGSNQTLPCIDSIEPQRVELGASTTIHGHNFLPNTVVRIGYEPITPLRATADHVELEFPVAVGTAVDGSNKVRPGQGLCDSEADVSIETEHGSSEPVAVTFVYPAPRLRAKTLTVTAGESFELRGVWLAEATGDLQGQEVDVKIVSYEGDPPLLGVPTGVQSPNTHRIPEFVVSVVAPTTTTPGTFPLLIRTLCGETSLALTILPAAASN